MNFKTITRIAAIAASSLLVAGNSFAHWNSKGPYGGALSCITTVDTNVLIGTYEGGVFINTTSAATAWKPVNQGLTSGKIGALTQLGSRILAGTKDAGIFITTDRGSTWAASNSGLSNLQVQAFAKIGSSIFAGTASGAFLSTDSGATWSAINTGLTTQNVTSFAVNGTTIYAATSGGGVFSSTNSGTSWTAINSGLSGAGLTLNSIVADGSMLYASNASGVYMYMGSWSAFNTGLTNTYVTSLSINSGITYATTAGGIFQSSMMGAWTALSTGLPADTTTGAVAFGGKIYAATKNNGLYSSSASTVNFVAANSGLNNLKTYALATLDTNTILTATNKGVFLSSDLAATYSRFNAGLTDSLNVNCLLIDGTMMKFAGTKNAGVFSNMSNGTWSSMSTGLVNLNVRALAALSGATHKIYTATADGKVYSYASTSSSWTDESTGLPSGINVTALVTIDTVVYLASSNNGVYYKNGSSWTAANTGLTNQNVTSLAVLNGYIYAGTVGGGVFKAARLGSWSAANSGLPSMNIYSLSAAAPFIVAGYHGGIYVSNDGGATWVVPGIIANIPPYADVTSLSIAKTRAFAGLPNNSLYSNAITEFPVPTGIITINQQKAAGNITVVPNPNTGRFELKITELKDAKIADISVYDITGKKVQQLTSSLNQAVDMNFSKGMYFILVNTNQGSISQKVIVQ